MTPRILRLALLAPILLASLLLDGTPALAATGFHAAWVDQSPWPSLRPGVAVSYTIHFRNTRTETWERGVAGRQGVQWGAYDGSLFVAQPKESDLRRFTLSGAVATQRDVFFNGTYGRIRTAPTDSFT